MQKLLKKAKAFLKQAKADIECGTHSGFRPCCIFSFAILDNISHLNQSKFFRYRRLFNRAVLNYRDVSKNYGYIPCPVCVWFKPIEVKECLRSDHKNTITHSDWDDLYGSYQEFAKRNTTLYADLKMIDRLFRTFRTRVVDKNPFFENRTSW